MQALTKLMWSERSAHLSAKVTSMIAALESREADEARVLRRELERDTEALFEHARHIFGDDKHARGRHKEEG